MNQSKTILPQRRDTAILVFSRSAREEAVAKKYNKFIGSKGGIAIAAKLIQHTITEAEYSGLPVIKIFSDQQIGKTFGERFANAIEHAFSLGYPKLIISGTDSPSVLRGQFIDIKNQLCFNKLVSAPSTDGGIYLLGIHKDAFKKAAFLKMPWLTNAVHSSLLNYALVNKISFDTATKGLDIDHITDFLELIKNGCDEWFRSFAKALLSRLRVKTYLFNSSIIIKEISSSTVLRGPPFNAL